MSGPLQRLLRIGLALGVRPAMLVDEAASALRRLMVLLACVILAMAVLLPALGCAAAGVWILVQHHLGPVWAAFITAGVLALVAVVVLLIGLAAARGGGRERRAARTPAVDSDAVAGIMEAAAAGAAVGRGFFARHKAAFLLGAAVAGLVMGQDLFRGRPKKPGHDPK